MIVEPREFLKMTDKNGYGKNNYLQAMCVITENIIPIHVGIAAGKRMFFRYVEEQDRMDYIMRSMKEVEHSEHPHADAFQLLKVLAH